MTTQALAHPFCVSCQHEGEDCRCTPADRALVGVDARGVSMDRLGRALWTVGQRYIAQRVHPELRTGWAVCAAAERLMGCGMPRYTWRITDQPVLAAALQRELDVRAEGDDPFHYASPRMLSDDDLVRIGRVFGIPLRVAIAEAAE